MYDCKLMELGERSLWSGWAAGRSFFVVEGGGRMADGGRHPSPRLFDSGREVVMGVWGDWRKWGLMRAGGLSGFPGVG